jgi:hypothetical protein
MVAVCMMAPTSRDPRKGLFGPRCHAIGDRKGFARASWAKTWAAEKHGFSGRNHDSAHDAHIAHRVFVSFRLLSIARTNQEAAGIVGNVGISTAMRAAPPCICLGNPGGAFCLWCANRSRSRRHMKSAAIPSPKSPTPATPVAPAHLSRTLRRLLSGHARSSIQIPAKTSRRPAW